MSKRVAFWDNFKGILIFLVVFGHFIYSYAINSDGSWADSIFTFIYTFHMPAFIFSSGYLSKSEKSSSYKALLKLFICYIVFNFGMMVFLRIYNGTSMSFLTPYNSYWFILSLIYWRISIKSLSKIKGILPLSIIIALLVGFWDFPNTLSIRRTFTFFPFFLMGYKLEKEKLNRLLNNRTIKKTLFSFILVFIIGISGIILLHNYNPLTFSTLVMGKYTNAYDIIYRIVIFGISILAILGMLFTVFKKEIPFLTKIGKNSLLIYLVHRFITIIFYTNFFPDSNYSGLYIIYGFIATVIVCFIFSLDKLNNWFNSILNKTVDLIVTKNFVKIILIILLIAILSLKPLEILYDNIKVSSDNDMYETNKMEDNFIKLSYVGDLILLKDQVTSAYDTKTQKYNFNSMFEYAKPYLEDADYTIGVFEGPTAGNSVPYSTSNYDDGIKLYLNFPDEFAEAVKWSGIDYVTTANNHLLDRGKEGALRTLDILDKVGLEHSGSYRNEEEKSKIFITNVENLKVAILSYTSFVNYYAAEKIVEDMPYITSIIPYQNNKYYDELLADIEDDFKQAKQADVDLIIVASHMGTQFKHTTNEMQNKWNKIFADLGADIVLGDHAHAVQPIEYIDDTLVINCPGNFANSYIKYDGDATSIINIYVDKNSKEVIATSVVPMYTQEVKNGYFRALPIYEIVKNKKLYQELSAVEMLRVKEVKDIVLKSTINENVSIDDNRKEYYFMNDDFYDKITPLWYSNDDYKNTKLYKLFETAKSITFIGDSITEGTKNGGYPWYLPLTNVFKNKKVNNISKGSYTTSLVINDFADDILDSNSDLYVLAIGTNDVRYQNDEICAMTSSDYVTNIEQIVKLIKDANDDANILFIAPWMTLADDHISILQKDEKDKMIDEYSIALEKYANDNGYLYINPNSYLRNFFQKYDYRNFMVDAIHPNRYLGIEIYSLAVMESSK